MMPLKYVFMALVLVMPRVLGNPAHTFFAFSRAMDTCDVVGDVSYESTVKVVYAYNDEDPRNGIPPQHTVKGVVPMDFRAAPFTQEGEYDTHTADLVRPPLELPYGTRTKSLNSTYYWSSGWDLWDVFAKQGVLVDETHPIHITKWDMLLDENNFKNIHHANIIPCPQMEQCPECLEEDYWGESGSFGEEGDDTVPKVLDDCWLLQGTTPVMTWVLAAEPSQYPPEAGLKVGGVDGIRYVLYELHYDIPTYDPPEVKLFGQDYADPDWRPEEMIVDTTGMRFWYTETLRPYEIGFAWFGVNADRDNFLVPPHQPEYVVYAVSNPNCWDPVFPEGVDEINVVQVLQHAHIENTKLKTRHIRDGVELPPVADDPHYNTYYQQWVANEFTWKKGDIFIVECTINSMAFSHTLTGGVNTDEQMCMTFFMIYPSMGAASMPDWSIYNITAEGESFTSNAGDGMDCRGEVYGWPEFVPYEEETCEHQDPALLGDTTVRRMERSDIDFSVYEHHRVLDAIELEDGKFSRVVGSGKYNLYWTRHADECTIDFLVDVETTGWIGFGVSPNGGMKGADIIMMYVDDETGEPVIWDMHGLGNFAPAMDTLQDLYNVKGYQDYTTFSGMQLHTGGASSCDSVSSSDVLAMQTNLWKAISDLSDLVRDIDAKAGMHADRGDHGDENHAVMGDYNDMSTRDGPPGASGGSIVFLEVVAGLILLLAAGSFVLLWKSRKGGYVAAATADEDMEMRA